MRSNLGLFSCFDRSSRLLLHPILLSLASICPDFMLYCWWAVDLIDLRAATKQHPDIIRELAADIAVASYPLDPSILYTHTQFVLE